MDLRDIVRTIQKIEKDCKIEQTEEGTSGNWEHQKNNVTDYEKFYNKVMGVVELADEVSRPRGGTYG